MKQLTTAYVIFFLSGLVSCGPAIKNSDYLLSFTDTVTSKQGYKNQNGDIIITAGKYSYCFTDTFTIYAIVAKQGSGFLAIDRKENVLYEVFPFDNGPDMPADGLFRILVDKKIGYADLVTGKIIIQPKFDCAQPFENGVAMVSTNCKTQIEGGHSTWLSDAWYYVDKTGKKVDQPREPKE